MRAIPLRAVDAAPPFVPGKPCILCGKPTKWGFEFQTESGERLTARVCLTCNDRPDVRTEDRTAASSMLIQKAVGALG